MPIVSKQYMKMNYCYANHVINLSRLELFCEIHLEYNLLILQ